MTMHASSSPGPDGDSAEEMDVALKRLREEASPAYLASMAWGLPARVRARVEEEERWRFFKRWSLGLGALSVGCAALAVTELQRAGELAMTDPLLAGWLLAMLN